MHKKLFFVMTGYVISAQSIRGKLYMWRPGRSWTQEQSQGFMYVHTPGGLKRARRRKRVIEQRYALLVRNVRIETVERS